LHAGYQVLLGSTRSYSAWVPTNRIITP
jgi:hypothetical protein